MRFKQTGIVLLCLISANLVYGAQNGPRFPSHRFPTDRSYHLGYDFSFFRTTGNFVSAMTTEPLTDEASLKIFRHSLSAEIQPNRKFSAGLELSLDAASLGDPSSSGSATRSGPSDQRVFAEYRFIDRPGLSLGSAILIKFPAYTNLNLTEIQDLGSTVFLGDAQSDLSVMLTSEYWFSMETRFRVNAGYTHRLESFAPELPFMVAFGIVTPKFDVDFRVIGNLALGQSIDDPDLATLRQATANSRYALSDNPSTIILNPVIELWTTNQLALVAEYKYSLFGSDSPFFHEFRAGFTYRWAERDVRTPRTFQQIDIRSDHEEGSFGAETKRNEPRIVNPQPIVEEPIPGDEEFF